MNRFGLLTILGILSAAPLTPVAAQDLLWARQTGTSTTDGTYGIALDGAGNAYIAGITAGNLAATNAGNVDIFLAKYSASGASLWTRQIGTYADDIVTGVAADSAGNTYVVGYTYGPLGNTPAGDMDIFLLKYNTSGTVVWKRQMGSYAGEYARAVALDSSGNLYIAGFTDGPFGGTNIGETDVFLAKCDPSGALLWVRQAGTTNIEEARGVAVDAAGNAYITGSTRGSLFGTSSGFDDAFLAKYSPSGTLLWGRQLGTINGDYGYCVAVDGSGNPCIAGFAGGNLGGTAMGGSDVFLAKFDTSGSRLWTRQIGTSDNEQANGMATDAAGSIYIAGQTGGALGGTSAGAIDAFLIKYTASGDLVWTRQIGTNTNDYAQAVAVDAVGNAVITGGTSGSLGGPYAGSGDAYLVKYSRPLCPSDFNRDGLVTGEDFDAYVAAFTGGTANSDFNRDTFVTGEDFDAYVAAFEAGC